MLYTIYIYIYIYIFIFIYIHTYTCYVNFLECNLLIEIKRLFKKYWHNFFSPYYCAPLIFKGALFCQSHT